MEANILGGTVSRRSWSRMPWDTDVRHVVGVCNLEIFGIVLVLLMYETIKEGLLAPMVRMLLPVHRTWRGLPMQFLIQQIGVFYILVILLLIVILLRQFLPITMQPRPAHMAMHASKLIQAKALGHQILLS
jgi:hypothetical protein